MATWGETGQPEPRGFPDATDAKAAPEVFLLFDDQLVGVFHGDTVTVDPDHRGRHLSRELILAGFAQAPWKNKERKVTEAGKAALEGAYRFVLPQQNLWGDSGSGRRPKL